MFLDLLVFQSYVETEHVFVFVVKFSVFVSHLASVLTTIFYSHILQLQLPILWKPKIRNVIILQNFRREWNLRDVFERECKTQKWDQPVQILDVPLF